jgi:hypothetical protein
MNNKPFWKFFSNKSLSLNLGIVSGGKFKRKARRFLKLDVWFVVVGGSQSSAKDMRDEEHSYFPLSVEPQRRLEKNPRIHPLYVIAKVRICLRLKPRHHSHITSNS